jgi:hypothetical protein
MNGIRKAAVFGSLLLFGAAGCADLLVDNVNNPDRRRALATPGDVEGLVSGAYRAWYSANHHVSGPTHIFSTQAFDAQLDRRELRDAAVQPIPREAIQNSVTHADFGNIAYSLDPELPGDRGGSEGLRAIENRPGHRGRAGGRTVRAPPAGVRQDDPGPVAR